MESWPYHERAHWLSFGRGLHIEESSLFSNIGYLEPAADLTSRFRDDGYVQGSAEWGLDIKLMADTVRALSAANVSPLFAFVYDEFWYPCFKLHRLHSALLGGGYCLLPELCILNIDPQNGGAGWRPHRDKGRQALFDDGSPKSLTTWISLTTATPLNGCIYAVPPQQDPTYGTADEMEMRFEHQSVRALPTEAGDFLIWNQSLFHWGGKTSPRATESRVSIAFQFQRADLPAFSAPLMQPLQVLPFAARIKLIAQQLYRYRHLHDLDSALAKLACEPPAELPLESAASPTRALPASAPAPAPNRSGVGRNAPCPCGSGKRYKHCHGALG